MAVIQYIGARYVPKFSDKPWNKDNIYEPLIVVEYRGASYISKQPVPAGIDITDEKYWCLTGNYNYQIEVYRREVTKLAEKVEHLEQEIRDLKEKQNG